MDDNFRLDEWLAYHYHAMKLRYVVLNVDPFSRTSPSPVIERWNNAKTVNMTIVTMHDRDYVRNFAGRMARFDELAQLNETEDRDYQLGRAKTEYIIDKQVQFYKGERRGRGERWGSRLRTLARRASPSGRGGGGGDDRTKGAAPLRGGGLRRRTPGGSRRREAPRSGGGGVPPHLAAAATGAPTDRRREGGRPPRAG